jgi:uncharacterized protein
MNSEPNLAARVLIVLIKGYRLFFSAWLGSACRFTPTCSAYSMLALQEHGAVRGTGLTLARLARCHPWCAGGIDLVPKHSPPSSGEATLARAIRRSARRRYP